jgi:hypothetical protein
MAGMRMTQLAELGGPAALSEVIPGLEAALLKQLNSASL